MNGIIIINKEADMTSRDVVNKLTRLLQTKKIGHTGTLDPLAKGVLVCTIGKCTKLNDLLMSTYKEYHVEFVLGYETDTLDITGVTNKKSDVVVIEKEIINTIKNFIGNYDQEVPAYSAVKINGKKLYEYARNNEQIELPKRNVEIKSISNISVKDKTISFDTCVSKGTYIRSLVRDIGRKVGTYACMSDLIRTKQGDFDISDSYTLKDVESGKYKLIKPEELFNDMAKIEVDENLLKKISNGVSLNLNITDEYVRFFDKNELKCIYKRENDVYKMYVIF